MGRIDMSDDAKDVFCFMEQLQKLIVDGNLLPQSFPARVMGPFGEWVEVGGINPDS